MFFTSLRPTTPPLGYIMPDKAGNFLYISKYPTNSQTFNGASPVLAPAQAYAIDSKIDDGLPMSGSVRPTWANNTCPNIPAANGPCFNIPMKKSVLLPDGNTATIYTVDDTVTPSIYHTNNYTIPNGYTIYATTSISISVD